MLLCVSNDWLFVYRFLGFSPLLTSTCNVTNTTSGDIRVIYLNKTLDLDAFFNPVALLLCYYVLVISSGFILDTKVNFFYFSVATTTNRNLFQLTHSQTSGILCARNGFLNQFIQFTHQTQVSFNIIKWPCVDSDVFFSFFSNSYRSFSCSHAFHGSINCLTNLWPCFLCSH